MNSTLSFILKWLIIFLLVIILLPIVLLVILYFAITKDQRIKNSVQPFLNVWRSQRDAKSPTSTSKVQEKLPSVEDAEFREIKE